MCSSVAISSRLGARYEPATSRWSACCEAVGCAGRSTANRRLPTDCGAAVTTSDLTIDETLLLQTIGWEARGMVSGTAVYSIPKGFWSIGKGESTPATLAYERAVRHAAEEVSLECRRFHGHGVAGVHIEHEVTKHYVESTIVGTAIGPGTGKSNRSSVFVSDLSIAEKSVLLRRAGWQTVGLVFGASFVFIRRRNPIKVAEQVRENVELSNFTEALCESRAVAISGCRPRPSR